MKAALRETQQSLSGEGACITTFETHQEAERAVKELEKSGHNMRKLSIIGTDYRKEDQVTGYYNTGDRIMFWGSRGAFWGGLWGMLFGSAFFLVPGIGPLVLAGPIVSMLVAGLEGAITLGGTTALGAALYSIGIPKDSVLQYETGIKSHKFLLIAHGTQNEVQEASEALHNAGFKETEVHDAGSTIQGSGNKRGTK
jgi:uncharacterized membrane protein